MILLTGVLSRKGDPLVIGVIQIGTIALLATGASLLFETPRLPQTGREWGSILALALVCSCLLDWVPVFQHISAGIAIVICTVLAAGVCAALFPISEEEAEEAV